jgi:hypothetical protein
MSRALLASRKGSGFPETYDLSYKRRAVTEAHVMRALAEGTEIFGE